MHCAPILVSKQPQNVPELTFAPQDLHSSDRARPAAITRTFPIRTPAGQQDQVSFFGKRKRPSSRELESAFAPPPFLSTLCNARAPYGPSVFAGT